MRLTLALLLLAVPLSAQQTVVVPDVRNEITNLIEDIALSLTITHQPDSAEVARQEESLRLTQNLADFIEECGCIGGGSSSTTVQLGVSVALPLLTWIAISLHRNANKEYPEYPKQPEPEQSEGRGES